MVSRPAELPRQPPGRRSPLGRAPTPTQRSVQISRTTLFSPRFTALPILSFGEMEVLILAVLTGNIS